MRVQFVEDDARFDPDGAIRPREIDDAVEVLGRIELQPGADGLSCLRCAAASRRDGNAVSRGDLHRADDILARLRNDDPERLNLVDAGVG